MNQSMAENMIASRHGSIVAEAERLAASGASFEALLPTLRRLTLEEFGRAFIEMPSIDLPALSKAMPAMASAEVQRNWTGASGIDLLRQSLTFVHQLSEHVLQYTGRPLAGQRVLDFVCGYGRLFRLLYYFSNPGELWGVDAWARSIALCKDAGLPGNFAQSDLVPTALPVGGTKFDVAFAFSIFTHLSPHTAEACLNAVRASMADRGIFVLTVRNREFWPFLDSATGSKNAARMLADVDAGRFGYLPHNGPEGETYGDSAIPLNFFDRPGWRIEGSSKTHADPFQVSVILRAV